MNDTDDKKFTRSFVITRSDAEIIRKKAADMGGDVSENAALRKIIREWAQHEFINSAVSIQEKQS